MRTLKTFSCAWLRKIKRKYTISLSRYEENADDSEVHNLISVYPDGAAKPLRFETGGCMGKNFLTICEKHQ